MSLLLRALALAVILAATLASTDTAIAPEHGMDRSVKPGDDFYHYANGGWLQAVARPDGRTYDNRAMLFEKAGRDVSDLVHGAAAGHSPKGSPAQKVGDYYASVLDEDGVEARGPALLAKEMARVAAIEDRSALSAYLGSTLNVESDGLIANADHVLGLFVNQGFDEWKRNVPHLMRGGLGMPSRDHYLHASAPMAEARARYRKHVAAMLALGGIPDADEKAGRVLELETRLARAWAPDSDAADVFKQDNPWKKSDFPARAPGMDWDAYFRAAGLEDQKDFVVWDPTAVQGVSALVNFVNVGPWRDYLRLHLLEHYAVVLSRGLAAEHLALATEPGKPLPDRETVALAATNGALGQAVGRLYTDRHFPPEAKARAQAMARGLVAAYRARIPNLSWMSAETKQKALAKLDAFTIGVGYPDRWIDYATLEVVRGDAFGNMRRAEELQKRRSLEQLKQPVDPGEWRIDPHVPGAIIMFSPNSEFFSAAILQPPYFDYRGDPASNYGSAGAGMAHEIGHGFDELGNIYDAHGVLVHGSWWTAEDLERNHAAAARLAAQLDGYCPLPGLCLDGRRVLNESMGDLTGLLVAHDAYVASLEGKPDAVIGGLTGEQRFFLAFAERWRRSQSEASLRRQIATDTHAPGEDRAQIVRNVEEWYTAFQVAPGDKLYLRPEDRVRIW
jgi:putative endopeptidase